MEKKVKENEKNALVVANEKKNVEQEAAAIQKEIEQRTAELQKCLAQHPERYPGIRLNILRRALISGCLGACDMKMHPPRDMKCTRLATDECTQRADGRGCRNALPSILSVIP